MHEDASLAAGPCLDASTYLYKRPCLSVRRSVTLSSKLMKMAFYGFKVILTVLDEEERETRRKQRQGGRNDEEERATRRVKK